MLDLAPGDLVEIKVKSFGLKQLENVELCI